MTESRRHAGRLQLILIALVFFGPLALAAWLYYGGHFQADGERTNHGALLDPYMNLPGALPDSPLVALNEGHWLLLYMHTADCREQCREALYTQRQSYKMLGREMNRVRRIFLHGAGAPDTVFLSREHEGLAAIEDPVLAGLLADKRPDELPAGGYYLIDPLGNLVMYFRPDMDPSDMVDDIKHLLRLSSIG